MTRDSKRVIYFGYAGDQDSPYEFQGVKFFPRIVQPVSDILFEMVRHVHGFKVVEGVNLKPLDLEDGKTIIGSWL